MKYAIRGCLLFTWFLSVSTSLFGFYDTPQSDSIRAALKNGDYEKAKFWLIQAKDSIEPENDSMQVEWLFRYSVFTSVLREYDSSFKSLTRALNLAQKINSLRQEQMVKIQFIEWYRNSSQHIKAINVIESLNPERIVNPDLKCRFYHRAAAVYNEYNIISDDSTYLNTSLQYATAALKIAMENEFINYQATVLNELGSIYERKGEDELAIKNYKAASKLLLETNYLDYINAIKNIGGYYLRQAKYDSAIVAFSQVINSLDSGRQQRIYADTYWGLKFAYYGKGDTLQGLKFALLEAQTNEALAYNEVERRVHEVAVEYEADQKDILIEKANQKLSYEKKRNNIFIAISILFAALIAVLGAFFLSSQKKNRRLKSLMKENEFLVSESNHRIKNNLQLIISLIGREIYKENKSNSSLSEISEKINSIATLHQQLYLNNRKETIEIKKYIIEVFKNFESHLDSENISLDLKVDSFSVSIDRGVYIGLLITELVTNSLKHAFDDQQNKNISFKISLVDKKVILHYTDNGKGLEENQTPSLVNLLSKQLKAEVTAESTIGYSLKLKFKV